MKRKLIVFAAALLASSSIVAIKNTNYCFFENRRTTSQEMIKNAIHEVISNQVYPMAKKNQNGDVRHFVPDEVIKYKMVNEFLDKNPGCCKISAHSYEGLTPSFLQKITGKVSTFVEVNYRVNYRQDPNGEIETFLSTRYIAIDRCGNAVNNYMEI